MSEILRLAEDAIARSQGGQAPMDVFAAVVPWARRALAYAGAGWILTDPETHLVSGILSENVPADTRRRLIELEREGGDVNGFAGLAVSSTGVARMSVATGGDLLRSRRYRELYAPLGYGDELRGVLRVDGAVWGQVCLARGRDEAMFDDRDEAIMASLMADLAPVVRAAVALPVTDGRVCPAGQEQGVLILGPDDGVVALSDSAREWLDQLPDEGTPLPAVVQEVAAHARVLAGARPDHNARVRVRVRSTAGEWCVLSAVRMGPGPDAQTAVVIEPVVPGDLTTAIARLHGLTARELEIARLLVAGRRLEDIAAALWLSTHTVRDHVKSAYAKLGARTRPELTAMLLAAELAPVGSARR